MKKFLLTYWLSIALLFTLFYWEFSPFSQSINNLQTNLTSFLTSLVLAEGMMEANKIFITTHYALLIEKGCNAMVPYLFFLASILAFPSTFLHKIKWIIMGYLFITSINIFRIWFITQFVMSNQNNFSLAHDYLGNGLLILTGLMLFIAFIKTRAKKKSISSNNIISLEKNLLTA